MDANTIPPDLRRLLGAVQLTTDDRPYSVVSLPLDQMRAATILFGGLAEPFAAMIVDKDEVTIVMREIDWSLGSRGLKGMRVEIGYRLITLDVTLDSGVIGFLAVVSRWLADAGIAMLPIAAYSRDHILVHTQDYDRASQALSELIAACKSTSDG
jgi:hypothetical protein